MLKNYKLQQSAITLTVILSLTFNITRMYQIQSCYYSSQNFYVQSNAQSNFSNNDKNISTTPQTGQSTQSFTSQSKYFEFFTQDVNEYTQEKIWSIPDKRNMEIMFTDQIVVMQAFQDQNDIQQLEGYKGCQIAKIKNQDCYQLKIVTKKTQFDLKQYLQNKSIKKNQIKIADILFKIALSVKKLHEYNVLHLNLNFQSIQFLDIYTPILSNLEHSMIRYNERTFYNNQDSFVAPEIDQYKNQNENDGIIQNPYTPAADVYSLSYIFCKIIEDLQLQNHKFFNVLYNSLREIKNSTPGYRSSINQILAQICQLIKDVYLSDKTLFENTMNEQQQFYNQMDSQQQRHYVNYQKLIEDFNKRKALYQQIMQNKDKHYSKLFYSVSPKMREIYQMKKTQNLNVSATFAFQNVPQDYRSAIIII